MSKDRKNLIKENPSPFGGASQDGDGGNAEQGGAGSPDAAAGARSTKEERAKAAYKQFLEMSRDRVRGSEVGRAGLNRAAEPGTGATDGCLQGVWDEKMQSALTIASGTVMASVWWYAFGSPRGLRIPTLFKSGFKGLIRFLKSNAGSLAPSGLEVNFNTLNTQVLDDLKAPELTLKSAGKSVGKAAVYTGGALAVTMGAIAAVASFTEDDDEASTREVATSILGAEYAAKMYGASLVFDSKLNNPCLYMNLIVGALAAAALYKFTRLGIKLGKDPSAAKITKQIKDLVGEVAKNTKSIGENFIESFSRLQETLINNYAKGALKGQKELLEEYFRVLKGEADPKTFAEMANKLDDAGREALKEFMGIAADSTVKLGDDIVKRYMSGPLSAGQYVRKIQDRIAKMTKDLIAKASGRARAVDDLSDTLRNPSEAGAMGGAPAKTFNAAAAGETLETLSNMTKNNEEALGFLARGQGGWFAGIRSLFGRGPRADGAVIMERLLEISARGEELLNKLTRDLMDANIAAAAKGNTHQFVDAERLLATLVNSSKDVHKLNAEKILQILGLSMDELLAALKAADDVSPAAAGDVAATLRTGVLHRFLGDSSAPSDEALTAAIRYVEDLFRETSGVKKAALGAGYTVGGLVVGGLLVNFAAGRAVETSGLPSAEAGQRCSRFPGLCNFFNTLVGKNTGEALFSADRRGVRRIMDQSNIKNIIQDTIYYKNSNKFAQHIRLAIKARSHSRNRGSEMRFFIKLLTEAPSPGEARETLKEFREIHEKKQRVWENLPRIRKMIKFQGEKSNNKQLPEEADFLRLLFELFIFGSNLERRLEVYLTNFPNTRGPARIRALAKVFAPGASVVSADAAAIREAWKNMVIGYNLAGGNQDSKTQQESKNMNLRELRDLVSEVIKENHGSPKGYTPYPYHSHIGEEEEENPDFMQDWKDFEMFLTRDESRNTAIEVAKILVKDLELFGDVIDLVGKNQSVATEILKNIRKNEEKT